MFKLCVLSLVTLLGAYADEVKEAEMKLETLFSEIGPKMNNFCGGIEGELDNGCFECYLCEDERLRGLKIATKTLKLKSTDCITATTVCCLPTNSLTVREIENCGKKQTKTEVWVNGQLQNRTSVRSVLSEEYPWRAWVYTKTRYGLKLHCAATAVDATAEVVMTSAACVHGYRASDLAVAFIRGSDSAISLRAAVIHPSYNPSKKYVNDIALLILNTKEQRPPGWVSHVCLPTSPPFHATSCISISDEDTFLTAVVPLTKKCEALNIKSEDGQICAVAPIGDYMPEHGAALLCQEELGMSSENYYAAGIALHTDPATSVTTFTAIHHHNAWISEVIARYKS